MKKCKFNKKSDCFTTCSAPDYKDNSSIVEFSDTSYTTRILGRRYWCEDLQEYKYYVQRGDGTTYTYRWAVYDVDVIRN